MKLRAIKCVYYMYKYCNPRSCEIVILYFVENCECMIEVKHHYIFWHFNFKINCALFVGNVL